MQQANITPAQSKSLTALQMQAVWFSGFFYRQAQRIMREPVNDR